jgi:hypothetical protein
MKIICFQASEVKHNRFAFNPSNDDVVQGAGGIYASFARHGFKSGILPSVVNIETNVPISLIFCVAV